jgi:uncharacterized Tic20 family protein
MNEAADASGTPYAENPADPANPGAPIDPRALTVREARQWAMVCHLVALSGLLFNGIGFLLGPLVVWLIKREDDPFIDEQGKEAVNFQLTMFLLAFLCIPFIFILIGIPMIMLVGLMMIVFPVIAAIQSGDGKHYRYPLSIRFIK